MSLRRAFPRSENMVSERGKKIANDIAELIKPKNAEMAAYLKNHAEDKYSLRLNALATLKLSKNDKRYGEVLSELVIKVRDDYKDETARHAQREKRQATA